VINGARGAQVTDGKDEYSIGSAMTNYRGRRGPTGCTEGDHPARPMSPAPVDHRLDVPSSAQRVIAHYSSIPAVRSAELASGFDRCRIS
jgi:hypothetical protein